MYGYTINMSNVIEDTRYVNISSQHGISKPAEGDYQTSYLSNMTFPFHCLLKEEDDILYSYVDIVSAQIPVSFYNINYTNNLLSYSMGGGITRTLTLTKGNYFATTLIAELKAQFLAAGFTVAIAYDRAAGRLTFSASQSFVFYAAGSTVLSVMGFSQTADYSSASNVLTAPFPVSFLSIKKLRFVSRALVTQSVGSFSTTGSSLFGTIPVNAPPFGLVQYDNTSGRKSLLRNKTIDEIDIQIMDENNRFINFNNTDWAITLAITTTRQFTPSNGRNFSNTVTPILQPIKGPEAGPEADVGQTSIFGDDSDLDFFLYKIGIDV